MSKFSCMNNNFPTLGRVSKLAAVWALSLELQKVPISVSPHCTTQIRRLAIIHFDWLYQWSCAKKCESKCYERSMVWPHFPVMLCMHCPVKRISYEIATTLPGYEEANLHEGKSISCLHHLVKIKETPPS